MPSQTTSTATPQQKVEPFKLVLSPAMDMALKRLQNSPGVIGLIAVSKEGEALRSSLDSTLTASYTNMIMGLCKAADNVVKTLDPTNELEFFRMRGKKHEIMIAPDTHCTLLVIQNPLGNNSSN